MITQLYCPPKELIHFVSLFLAACYLCTPQRTSSIPLGHTDNPAQDLIPQRCQPSQGMREPMDQHCPIQLDHQSHTTKGLGVLCNWPGLPWVLIRICPSPLFSQLTRLYVHACFTLFLEEGGKDSLTQASGMHLPILQELSCCFWPRKVGKEGDSSNQE